MRFDEMWQTDSTRPTLRSTRRYLRAHPDAGASLRSLVARRLLRWNDAGILRGPLLRRNNSVGAKELGLIRRLYLSPRVQARAPWGCRATAPWLQRDHPVTTL